MTPSGSATKSPLGNDSEMPPAPASNGCSQSTKPAPKWATLTPTRRKSHNHCAAVLADERLPSALLLTLLFLIIVIKFFNDVFMESIQCGPYFFRTGHNQIAILINTAGTGSAT